MWLSLVDRTASLPKVSLLLLGGKRRAVLVGPAYARGMITTHALLTGASTPVARGPLHSSRLRSARRALSRRTD
jgi:hypothetical protein